MKRSKWSCWRHSFTGMANRTNTWQVMTEKKKHSTLLPKKYHRSAIISTRSTGTFPLAFSQERPLPNSRCHGARDDTKTCVHIYIDGVCVRRMPDSMQRCHVWRLQSATSSCMTCGFYQRTPHCVRRCQIWLLQCCPVLWLQRCPTGGINVVNSPV